MSIKSKFRAFWKIATTRVPQKGWENVRGPDITRSPSISNTFRALVFGRGRKKRFYVVPTIRQVRKLFTTYPLASNSIFYGSLFVAAEVLQQTWNKGLATAGDSKMSKHIDTKAHPRYDSGSIKRYAVWGTLVIPPIYQTWYKWLDAKFHLCEKSPFYIRILMKKMVLDQFLLTPVILVLFFVAMNAMEGKADWLEECKHKFWKTFGADCCFWLPVQALNFIYVPSDLRVAFIAVTTFIWLNVLCWFKSLPIKETHCNEKLANLKNQIELDSHADHIVVDKPNLVSIETK